MLSPEDIAFFLDGVTLKIRMSPLFFALKIFKVVMVIASSCMFYISVIDFFLKSLIHVISRYNYDLHIIFVESTAVSVEPVEITFAR